MLLIGSFAGCNLDQGDNTKPTAGPATVPTTLPTETTAPFYENMLYHRTMTQEEKDAFIYYQATLHRPGSQLIYPFFEDFCYGYSYLGTINGWDILYKPEAILQLETTDNETYPYLTLGDVVFEGAYDFFFPTWNGTERKFIDDLYESGEINDEPLQDLLAAYKEAEQKRQAVTKLDSAKGRWAFQWLYWDIVAYRNRFPWYAIPDEEMPWGLLPDEVIDWELQPGEWTE